MKLLLYYLKNYKKLIILNVFSCFGFILVELGIPTIISKVIDEGIALNNIDYIRKMGIYIVIISILGVLGTILLGYCGVKISTSVTKDIRNDIFKKVQEFSHSEYDKFGVSSMITRTTNDTLVLMQFLNVSLKSALLAPMMFIFSFSMIIKTSKYLSGVLLIIIPIIILGVILISKISHPISQEQQKYLDKLNRICRENLTGIRVIRAFGNDNYEKNRFDNTNDKYTDVSKSLNKLMLVARPTFFLVFNIGVIIVFWISSKMINMRTLQVGQLIAFIEYLFNALFSVILFCNVFIMYPKAQASSNRIQELLETEPLVQNPIRGVKDTDIRASIEFNNVTFTYPNAKEPVIRNISFKGEKGQTIAFIGSTGSGKSSLINLIPRFYDVTKGSIKIDGIDIREYDLKELRKKIGFIPQKTVLFTGSIADNIKFGKDNSSEYELIYSAKVSQAYDFIINKENKFDEMISQGGKNLSGGQKQRLSIARAIIRKPEIYVFDDSFSALDFKTESILRSRLKEETKESLVLVVAQRVSSIMDANKIIVLNEGEVVGQGTHKELLKNCEVYKEIAYSQLTEEELANE